MYKRIVSRQTPQRAQLVNHTHSQERRCLYCGYCERDGWPSQNYREVKCVTVYAVKNLTKSQHQQNLVYRLPYGRGISSNTCEKDIRTHALSNRNIYYYTHVGEKSVYHIRNNNCYSTSMYVKVKKLSVVRPLGEKWMSKHLFYSIIDLLCYRPASPYYYYSTKLNTYVDNTFTPKINHQ